MAKHSQSTDKGTGLGLAFGAVALLGAIVMMISAPEIEAAWGFAAAIIFGGLAIMGVHVYK